ncbi:hypothetical protein KC853_01605, partial [Candidatus Saccharibacteria bacterium]|nr:hypothetical protein [Candidatus Saccharibacteria bacterium]
MVEDLSSPNTVYDSAPLPLGDQDDQDNAELGLSNQYFGQAFFDLLNKFKNGEIRSIADSEMIPDINYQICFEVGVEDIAKILWTEDPIEQFYRLSILLPILREAGANGQWAFLTIEKITKELNKCLGSYSALNSFFAMEVLGVAKKQKEDPDLSVLQIPGDKQHVRYQEGFVGSKEEEFDRYVASRFGYSKLASNESYYRISDGLVAIIDLGGVPTHVMECDQDMLNKLEEIPFVGRDIWEFIRQFKAGNLDYLSAYMGLRQALLEIEEYSPDINSGSLFQKLLGGDWQRIDQLLLARNEIEDQLLDLAKTLHDQLLDKNLEVAYGGIRDVLSLRPDYMTDSLVWDEIEEAYKDNDINQAWQEVHYLLVASRLQQVKDSELINLITSIYDRVTKTTIRHQEDTAKEYDQIVKNLDSQEADNIAATEEILERFENEGTLGNISSYIEQYIESFTDRIMPPVEPIDDYLLGLGIDKEAILLILATHSPFMRSRLWGDLGLDPGNFDITTQAKFLEYALRQDNTGFNNLRKVVYETRACDRDLFFDTFIALEYGGDYGDILVDIAQEALPE